MYMIKSILPQRMVKETGWLVNELGITSITRKQLLAPTRNKK